MAQIPPQQPPGPQRQATTQEIIQNMRDSISLINERAKDQYKGIFDNIIQQLAGAAQQLQVKDIEIKRLETLLKDNNIDFTPKPPQPNRAERRRLAREAKKTAKKEAKKTKKKTKKK